MNVKEIRSRLLRLEFGASASGEPEALVEFEQDAPLEAPTRVRVPLGRRNGLLRELVGQPRLLPALENTRATNVYRYRLQGVISEQG